MKRRFLFLLPLLLLPACAWFGNGADQPVKPDFPYRLETVATSPHQWTGVAVSGSGRLFVNFPLWSRRVPLAVGELHQGGSVTPYPDPGWNDWAVGRSADDRFVCVQAVFVDDEERLWVVDAANPRFEGVVDGGPKLVAVDLATDRVIANIPLGDVVPGNGYLNDVRIDTTARVAYLTDSGSGALIVVDLDALTARRVLDTHGSTKAEDVTVVVNGTTWRMPDGSLPKIHVDGIALSPDRKHVYYQALTGTTLFRVPAASLRDASLPAATLGRQVEYVARTFPADGILFQPDGSLLLSAIEDNAVVRMDEDGDFTTLVSAPQLAWPDTFAAGPGGTVYVTSSQIHFGDDPPQPYGLFRLVRD